MSKTIKIIKDKDNEYRIVIPERPYILKYARDLLSLINIILFIYFVFSKKIIIQI